MNKSEKDTFIQSEGCDAFDFERLAQRLHQVALKNELRVVTLGDIQGDPLLLLTPRVLNEGPRLLIAAAFHGDEPGGCWGIVRYLDTSDLRGKLNLSFLPLVNPSGLRKRSRNNAWGEDPNRGFYYNHPTTSRGANGPPASREGKILLDHLNLLTSLATHAFLSLHEDVECSLAYLYTFEPAGRPGPFSRRLREETAKFFAFFPDGPLEGGFVRDGIIFDFRDGSFEDLMFHSGVPRAACTEIPGLADVNRRVEAHAHLIAALSDFARAGASNGGVP